MMQTQSALIAFTVLVTSAWALGGCGNVTLGGGASPNDAVPSGVIVFQGQFLGQNGRTVSGTVSVYKTNCGASTCDFVLRLQNLSAPTDAGLTVVVTINGAVSTTQPPLRAATGNQNYNFTSGVAGASWNQVAIRVAPTANNYDYGLATLTAVAGT
ncbi:hypothetical protein WDW37_16540 [Bdellovibrionota bacterium FG-1]